MSLRKFSDFVGNTTPSKNNENVQEEKWVDPFPKEYVLSPGEFDELTEKGGYSIQSSTLNPHIYRIILTNYSYSVGEIRKTSNKGWVLYLSDKSFKYLNNGKPIDKEFLQKYFGITKKENITEPKVQEKIKSIMEVSENSKPSESLKKLNEDIEKYKELKYIISKQPENSISLFRFKQNEGVNLLEFSKTLLDHYKKKVNPRVFENVNMTGNETFVLIKNLPDSKMTDLIKNDLIKLLSK